MFKRVALCSLLIAAGFAVRAAAIEPPVLDIVPATCGVGDRPEPAMQGEVPLADQLSGASRQGYRCNVRPVAQHALEGGGGDFSLAWYRQCAYNTVPAGDFASDGVAVLDVRRPTAPVLQQVLRSPRWAGQGGVLGLHEGIHASERRGLLVVPAGSILSVYDIAKDCRHPEHLADLDIGHPDDPFHDPALKAGGMHAGQLTPDGQFYLATDLGSGGLTPNGPCLTIIDLGDPRAPKLQQRWGSDHPCHDLGFNEDGTRAYVGFYTPNAGYPAAVASAFTPAGEPAHATSGVMILDTTDLVRRRSAVPELRQIGQLTGGRQHTETFARIGGRKYVIAGEEGRCPAGNGRIVDVTDEASPVQVSVLPLEVNQVPCTATDTDNNLLPYMTHYISVDDQRDARLAFITWYSSGLRVFDIHDPAHPREVAYINPAVGEGASSTHDTSVTYTRYDAKSGQVWFGSNVSGFNVAELDPKLRPHRTGVAVSGSWSVPLIGSTIVAPPRVESARPAPYFCTMGLGG